MVSECVALRTAKSIFVSFFVRHAHTYKCKAKRFFKSNHMARRARHAEHALVTLKTEKIWECADVLASSTKAPDVNGLFCFRRDSGLGNVFGGVKVGG